MDYIRFLSMLRPEIVCLVSLIFVQMYAYYYRKTTARIFRVACWAAMVHLVFDIITVITVNNLEIVPDYVNKLCHMALYISAMLFCQIHLDYIAAQLLNNRGRRQLATFCRLLMAIYILATPIMTVSYTEDPITNYSGGSACYIVMGTAFLFFTFGILLIVLRHRRVERYVLVTSLLTTIFMMICVVMQLLIPTFLFTGCGISVVTIGMFFAIENPAKYYQRRAFVDISTGVKNKNCFMEDVKVLNRKADQEKKTKITVVVCDINWLKLTNDTYGHLEGDELIRHAAEVLTKCFQKEYSVYRFGGDEFIILFLNKENAEVEKEIQAVYRACEEIDRKIVAKFSLALGYATTEEVEEKDIQAVISLADRKMYAEKERIKAEHPYPEKNAG